MANIDDERTDYAISLSNLPVKEQRVEILALITELDSHADSFPKEGFYMDLRILVEEMSL